MTESIPEPITVVPVPMARRRVTRRFSVRFSAGLSRLLVRWRVAEIPHIKRIIVTGVGGTIIIFGFSLIWTPAPTGLLIPVGLAVLGTEYAWARRWMRKSRLMAGKALARTQKIIGGKDRAA